MSLLLTIKRSIAEELKIAGVHDPVVFIRLSLTKTTDEVVELANTYGLTVGFVVVRRREPVLAATLH